MWIPYLLARIGSQGLSGAMGNDATRVGTGPAWAERARRAHGNAVENLAVFAPVVLVVAITGANTPTTATAAQIYLAARLVHYVVYVLGIPIIRTLAFVVGLVCTLTIVSSVL
jgi:uncharacterized MAPEG superfamily protein